MRLIESVHCVVSGTTPVRLKGRGIVVHRRAMVPSMDLYEIQPGVWVGHPATILALERQIQEEMITRVDKFHRAMLGVGEAAAQSSLTYLNFAEAVKRVREIK